MKAMTKSMKQQAVKSHAEELMVEQIDSVLVDPKVSQTKERHINHHITLTHVRKYDI